MPAKLYLTNRTDESLFVIGVSGGDFGDSAPQQEVQTNETVKVAELSNPTSGFSDHWGWIYIGTGYTEPKYQLYISAGTVRGVFDYAVQDFQQGGINRNGDTIKDTEVSKTGTKPDEEVYYVINQPEEKDEE